MKYTLKKRLFWFLKEGTEIDLSNKVYLDMYVQQVVLRGTTSDIKNLFRTISILDFTESFKRIKKFLPREIKVFWEGWLGDINKPSEKEYCVNEHKDLFDKIGEFCGEYFKGEWLTILR